MKYLLFASIVMTIVSCSNGVGKNENASYITDNDTITIPVNSTLSSRLGTEKIITKEYRAMITTTGTVKAIPNNYAQVAAPFSGRITRSFVHLGQRVTIGSPIFEISSPDFYEDCKNYYQAKQQMQLAEKNLTRQADLLRNGVGVVKDMEESEVAYEMSRRDYENAIASLSVYNVNHEEIQLGQPLIVRSPINGEIVENNIVIGQYMRDDSDPVAIVAELNKVWVVGHLKEKDMGFIGKSDSVEIRLTCMTDRSLPGKVYHISEMLDEETRSVQVYIECDNSSRIMKPGMYVTVHFFDAIDNAILIPSQSVLQMEHGSFVFVQIEDGRYIKRAVEVTGIDNDLVLVNSGLYTGDVIISKGAFYLSEAN
ncbi:MAG: efflux RND transporter periplasmic adaptor subunit [Bacteroidales bacterium]|nr:efflux RND transporter periplasmic adaptor subunit [Bacteroidales bacterium]